MVKPVPDYRVYVIVCPMMTGSTTAHMYVQEQMMRDFHDFLQSKCWDAEVLYLLSIYAKPVKSADMVEMLKRGIPIE